MNLALSRLRGFSFLLGLLLVLSACSGAANPPATLPAEVLETAEESILLTAAPSETPIPTNTLPPTATETPSIPTATPMPTSTVNPNRLSADAWRDWPVVPEITGKALDVYRDGMTRSLNRHALSKVGDCQSISVALLGMYDHPDRYYLTGSTEHLASTIDWYAGSFDRDGFAVKGGYNAAAVLSPLWADPKACNPGETPLACELRLHKPVFAIISLEVWWDGRSPEVYKEYMGKIIEEIMANGTVPILSTKADNVEGDWSINLATAQLAEQYDLPLWNWWRAAQQMPYGGLDPTRPDGFHISYDAWALRSLTALEAVDALKTALEAAAGPVALTAAPTPAQTDQPDDLQTLVLNMDASYTSAPLGEILFDIFMEDQSSLGIFLLDPVSGKVSRLSEPNRVLQAVTTGGRWLAVSEGETLFIVGREGTHVADVTARFPLTANAVFTYDGKALTWPDAEGNLAVLPLDGSPASRISISGEKIVFLSAGAPAGSVYAFTGSCDDGGACNRSGLWQVFLDGSAPVNIPQPDPTLEFIGSSASGFLAFALPGANEMTGVEIRRGDLAPWQVGVQGETIASMAFSPDETQLSVLAAQRSNYSGKNFGVTQLLFTPETFQSQLLAPIEGMAPRQAWSADGQKIVRVSSILDQQLFRISFSIIDRNTTALSTLAISGDLPPISDFQFAGHVYWLP